MSVTSWYLRGFRLEKDALHGQSQSSEVTGPSEHSKLTVPGPRPRVPLGVPAVNTGTGPEQLAEDAHRGLERPEGLYLGSWGSWASVCGQPSLGRFAASSPDPQGHLEGWKPCGTGGHESQQALGHLFPD